MTMDTKSLVPSEFIKCKVFYNALSFVAELITDSLVGWPGWTFLLVLHMLSPPSSLLNLSPSSTVLGGLTPFVSGRKRTSPAAEQWTNGEKFKICLNIVLIRLAKDLWSVSVLRNKFIPFLRSPRIMFWYQTFKNCTEFGQILILKFDALQSGLNENYSRPEKYILLIIYNSWQEKK